jgi:FixJ family two-component response regulator
MKSTEKTGRTALLVDDDDLVRCGIKGVIESLGWHVIEAESADMALTVLEKSTSITALITDYAMPSKTGAELVQEVRHRHPRLPVLLITGYPDVPDSLKDIPIIEKPFRARTLAAYLAGLTGH